MECALKKQSHCLSQRGNSCTPAQLLRALTHFGMKALMPCGFLWWLGAKGGKSKQIECGWRFCFHFWSSVVYLPKGMDWPEEGWWGGEKAHVLTQDQMQ